MPIHVAFNFVPCSRPKSCHASPNHHRPITMLYTLMDMLRSNMFSMSNRISWPIIRFKPKYFCLVPKNHKFPIINSPILIPLNILQAWANMYTTRKRLLCCTCAPSSTSLKSRLIVISNNISYQSCFVVVYVVPSWPSITRLTQRLFLNPQEALHALLIVSQSHSLHPSSDVLQKIDSCPLKQQLCKY